MLNPVHIKIQILKNTFPVYSVTVKLVKMRLSILEGMLGFGPAILKQAGSPSHATGQENPPYS